MKSKITLALLAAPFAHPAQRAALALFGLLWLVFLPPALINGTNANGTVLTKLACLFMALHCLEQMDTLGNAQRTLQNRRAPSAAWTGCAQAGLRKISLAWLLLAAGMMAHYMLSKPAMHWATACALLSTMACLGTAAGLRRTKLPPARWQWLGHAALAALVALIPAQIAFGTGELLAWFGALPPAILLPLLLSWPVLAGWLHLRWRTQPALSLTDNWPAPSPSWRIRSHARRYTLLNQGALQIDGSMKPISAGQRWTLAIVPVLVAFQSMRTAWGDQLEAIHFLWMVTLPLLSTGGLVMRDLHWRYLLAPGSWRGTRIAFNIYFSTLSVQLPLALLFSVPATVAIGFARGQTAAEALHAVATHSVFVLEMACALAASVLLRGAGKWAVAAWALVVLPIGFMLIWHFSLRPGPLLKADPVYAATLLLATAAALLLARRVWTVQKLQPHLPQR